MSVFLCSPAAIQKEVEGKAWDYLIRIMMSLICFFVVLFAKAIVTASVCESVYANYQVIIVCLDCSSDIQQIRVKGNMLSLVMWSKKKKKKKHLM